MLIPSAGRDAAGPAVGTFAICCRPALTHSELSEVCIWGRARQEKQVPGTCFVLELARHRDGGCQCWGRVGPVSPSVPLQLQKLLHGAAEIAAPGSPLPSLAAFGVLDFVHMPAPSSQAGRSCFERLSKAMLSCLLPAPMPGAHLDIPAF